ncbi:hypothetical protein BsWGS_27207 [Bradybaena similaris]
MAGMGRVLLDATVTDVGLGPFVYPACGQCYSKLEFIKLRDCQLHQCQNCGRTYSSGQVQFRYRLCLTVTDGTTLSNLTIFGGVLNSFFGFSATEFHNRVISSAEHKYGPSYGNIIQVAVEQAFVGQRLLFGLKTSYSNSTQKHSNHINKHSAISLRDICQSSNTSSQKTTGRHFPDLIAVQIMPLNNSSFSATVVECLQHLETIIEESNLTPDVYSNRASLLQMLHVCPSSQEDKHCSSSNIFMRHVGQSHTVIPSCDTTAGSSLEQSSLAFSCDDSLDTIFVPKMSSLNTIFVPKLSSLDTIFVPEMSSLDTIFVPKLSSQDTFFVPPMSTLDTISLPPVSSQGTIFVPPLSTLDTVSVPPVSSPGTIFVPKVPGLNVCTSRNPESAVCLPDLHVSTVDQEREFRFCENGEPVKCCSFCHKYEIEQSQIRNCLTVQQGSDLEVILKKTCECVGLHKCVTRSTVSVTNWNLCGECKHSQKVVCDDVDVKVKTDGDKNRHIMKTVCDQSDKTKCDFKAACDYSVIEKHTVKTVCDQSCVDRHDVKTVGGQSDVNRHNVKTVCGKSDVNRHNVKTVCGQSDVNRHNVKTVCGQSEVNRHNVKTVCGQSEVNRHNVKTVCGKSDVNRHNVKIVCGKSDVNRHNVKTACGKNYVDRCNVKTVCGNLNSYSDKTVCSQIDLNRYNEKTVCGQFDLNRNNEKTICGLDSQKAKTVCCENDVNTVPCVFTSVNEEHKHGIILEYYTNQNIVNLENKENVHTTTTPCKKKHHLQKPAARNCPLSLQYLPVSVNKGSLWTREMLKKQFNEDQGFCKGDSLSTDLEELASTFCSANAKDHVVEMPGLSDILTETELTGDLSQQRRQNANSRQVPLRLLYSGQNTTDATSDKERSLNVISCAAEKSLSKRNSKEMCADEVMSHSTQFAEDISEGLTEEYASKAMEDCLFKKREGTSSKLIEDYPESEGLEVFLSKIREDNPSKLMEDSQSELVDDYPKSEGLGVFLSNIREYNPLKIMEDTASKIIEDYPESEGLNVLVSKIRKDNPLKLSESAASKLREDYPNSDKLDEFLPALTEDYPSELMADYPESENLDVFLSPKKGDFIEVYPESESFNVFVSKVREDSPSKLIKDYPSKLVKDCLESEDQGSSLRGDNLSQLRLKDSCPSNLRGYHSPKLVEDNPESEEFDAFLTKLNSSTTDHKNLQSQSVTTEKSTDDVHMKKLNDITVGSTSYQKMMNSVLHSCVMECETVGCDRAELGPSAVKLPYLVPVDSGHFDKVKKQSASQFVKNSQQSKYQSDKNYHAFRNIKTLQEPSLSHNNNNSLKQSTSQHIHYFRETGLCKNIKKHDMSKNIKTLMKQDVPKSITSVKKHSVSWNIKIAQKQGVPQTDTNSEKPPLCQAAQAHHKSTEHLKDVKKHKLSPNASSPQAKILSPPFENHEQTCKTAAISNSFKLGNSDIDNNSEQLTSSKTVGNKHNLLQMVVVTNAEEGQSVHNVRLSAMQTLNLHNSVKASEKYKYQKKHFVGHSENQILAGKVTSEKKHILLKSSQSQEKNTFPHRSKNEKKLTFLQSVAKLRKQPATSNVRTQKELPSQHTVQRSHKQTLPLNCTTPKQVLPNAKSSVMSEFFSKYTTPMKIPQQSMKTQRIVFSANSTNLKKQTTQNVKSSVRNTHSVKYVTPHLLTSQHCKDTSAKVFLNYKSKKNLQRNMKNPEKTVSSKYSIRRQKVCQQNPAFSGVLSSARDTTPKSHISDRNVKNIENPTLATSSENTVKGVLKLAGNTPTTEVNTQSFDLNSLSINVTLRRSKRKYHTGQLDDTNNKTNTNLFVCESTHSETCNGQVNNDRYVLAASPTGKISRLSHFDSWRESGNIGQTIDSLFSVNSCLFEGNSHRIVQKYSSNISENNSQKDSSNMSEKNSQKDSSSMSEKNSQKDSSNISEKNSQKDSSSMSEKDSKKDCRSRSHRNHQKNNTNISHQNFQKVSTSMSDRNVEEDSTNMADKNVQKDSTDLSQRNIQKDSTDLSHRNIWKDSTYLSHRTIWKDSTDLSHRNIHKDSTDLSHKNIQKDTTDLSHRKIQKDSTDLSHRNIQKDSADLSHRNIQKNSTSISDRSMPKDSADRPLQLSISNRKSSAPAVCAHDASTTNLEKSQPIWPHGSKQTSVWADLPVSFMEKTNNGVSVTSEVFSQERVFSSLSGQGDSDYRLGNSFDDSGNLGHGKDIPASQLVACSESRGCNTDVIDVNNYVTNLTNLNDYAAETMDTNDVEEMRDMKEHVTKIMNTNGLVAKIQNAKNSVADVANIRDCLTEIMCINNAVTEMNNNVTKITCWNNHVSETTDVNNCITEVAVNKAVAEIKDKNETITGVSLLKDISTRSEVLWESTHQDISDDSSVGELDDRSQREPDVRSEKTGRIQQFVVETTQFYCQSLGHHNNEHLSSISGEMLYPDKEGDKFFICDRCPKSENSKLLMCAACQKIETDKPLICDLGTVKALINSRMCHKRLQVSNAAVNVFSPQGSSHLAENDKIQSDSISDLFSSEDEDSVFVSRSSLASECGDVAQDTLLLPKPCLASDGLDRSYSQSTDNTCVNIQCQRVISGDVVPETLLLHKTNLTSGERTKCYSENQLGNISGRIQATKQVRFSDKNQEHNYFTYEAISHQPVVNLKMHHLKSSLKKGDTECELTGSQDLFSESSEALTPTRVESGRHCPYEDWDSSSDLFLQTPEQPNKKCVPLPGNMTPEQASSKISTPGMSRIGGIFVCAQPETLLSDHSFDLFTPSPSSNRNIMYSDSLFSPEICSHPVQVCITPDLFS